MRIAGRDYSVEVYDRLVVLDQENGVNRRPAIEVFADEDGGRVLVNAGADLADIVDRVGSFAAAEALRDACLSCAHNDISVADRCDEEGCPLHANRPRLIRVIGPTEIRCDGR